VSINFPTHLVRQNLIEIYQYSCNKTTHSRNYWIIPKTSVQLTSLHDTHTEHFYIFLRKVYKYIFSTNIHYHTQK